MKDEVKVAICQCDARRSVDEKDETLEYILSKIRELGKKSDLVVFPELVLGGYNIKQRDPHFRGKMYECAEEFPGGSSVQRIAEVTKDLGCYAIIGFPQKSGIKYEMFNSAMLLGPEGPIGVQPKVHIPVEEKHYFIAGAEPQVFHTELGKIGIMICYDMWFPETARVLALKGAEILVEVAFWFSSYTQKKALKQVYDMWMYLPVVRAVENQCHFVACNGVGDIDVGHPLGKWHALGRSKIVNALGEIIAKSKLDKEDVVIGTLTEEGIKKSATIFPVFGDREPTVYMPITNLKV